MEFQKIVNFLDATSDNEDLWRFVTKNGLKFMIKSFTCRTGITGNTYNLVAGYAGYNAGKVDINKTEAVLPLKHLSNFKYTID